MVKNVPLESIYDSLESLLEFFSSSKAEKTDRTTLRLIDHDLICLEARLALFNTKYKPSRKHR